MIKLKASEIIELDDEFIASLTDEIELRINSKKDKITKLYSLKEIQEITGQTSETLLRHVKNYTTGNLDKTHLVAQKIGRDWRVTEENLKTYLNQ